MYGKSSYNETYEKLVTGKTDYIGMVAYSLYKGELQQHLKSGKSKETFIDVHHNKASRSKYMREAKDLVNTFLQINADEHLKQVKEPLIKEIQKITRVSIKPISKWSSFCNWHNNGLGGFVPSFWKLVAVLIIFYSPLYNTIETKVTLYLQSIG